MNSDTYYRNYQELWLSRENQKLLKKLFSIKYEKTQMNHDALQVYKAIIDQVEKFFKLYDINQFRAKLSDAIERFEKLPINTDGNKIGKTETLRQILIGLQANGTRSNVKNLGIKTDLGLLQVGSGIKLDKDTQIVYQSPSGLFKRRIPLADL
ncbi:hypothetical protein PZ00_01605 [Lacticaseibacillus rhamnosus]|nr:hypothetical protein PZ00_01605 [Lacticaseibacillus rhamnosus]